MASVGLNATQQAAVTAAAAVLAKQQTAIATKQQAAVNAANQKAVNSTNAAFAQALAVFNATQGLGFVPGPGGTLGIITTVGTSLTAQAKAAANLQSAANKLIAAKNAAQSSKNTSGTSGAIPSTANTSPTNAFKFNLPPHKWSLPLSATKLDNDYSGKDIVYQSNNDHSIRRAIMWYYDGAQNISGYNSSGEVTTIDPNAQSTAANAANAAGTKTAVTPLDYNFGFQFLWNPEQITTSVQRNMSVTPSSADRFTSVQGMFPGLENVTFTIVLDRTNDFACFKETKVGSNDYISLGKKFYSNNFYPMAANAAIFDLTIPDLLAKGTMHDIEYIYKMINGGSPDGGTPWVNLLNRPTSDTGYLQPTVVAVRFGPDFVNSLSYVGWFSNISVNHTAFTETMIPIRSTVQISMDCLTGSQSV